jgi:ATP-binding cassette, subfamily B, bacterial PglK
MKKANKSYVQKATYLIKDQKKDFIKLSILFIISSAFEFLGIGIIGPYLLAFINPKLFIDSLTNIFSSTIIQSISIADIQLIATISLLLIFLLKTFISLLVNWKTLKFIINTEINMRSTLMKYYSTMEYENFTHRNSSEYVHAIGNLVGNFSHFLRIVLIAIAQATIAIVVFVLLYISIGNTLIILFLFSGLLGVIFHSLVKKKLSMYGMLASIAGAKLIKSINEGINGVKEIRVLNKTKYFFEKFIKNVRQLSENTHKAGFINNSVNYIYELLLVLVLVAFTSVFIITEVNLISVIPKIGVVSVALLRLKPSVTSIIVFFSNYRYSFETIDLLYDDFIELEKSTNKATLIQNKMDNQTTGSFKNIKMKNVFFKFQESKRWLLKNINLEIKAGQSIGIIGSSGSGKTTLIDIIIGLLKPSKGEIIYNDNKRLNGLDSVWISQIAYLPQETMLIDNTIRENITFSQSKGRKNNSLFEEAISKSNISTFVNDLPLKADTKIGENGARISGGQRQRVALARAFYHRRDVLVMDESTSSLDNKTEKEIIKELKLLKGNKTIIIIAHRLSTLKYCDRIFKIDNGEIVENSYADI